ncbi:hypothetical protein C9374_004929 [Naegleria lovaniensis]|uniref:Uncharacterized protein n=1 Tax=Naegleria lovaniensis TaxID=51637 RepID=A0AA88GR29_NAELO|nr:uncharacterized protein C9374_004929 [Naegleria lovaniensis]KAG2382962.1 hypothetical protein C9374_004929 [Naegleria lovaniensis]
MSTSSTQSKLFLVEEEEYLKKSSSSPVEAPEEWQSEPSSSTTTTTNVQQQESKPQHISSLYLFNYSNTPFYISIFYKENEGHDYEQQYDEILPFHPFTWFHIEERFHKSNPMHILGINLVDFNNSVSSQTFMVEELRMHSEHFWNGDVSFLTNTTSSSSHREEDLKQHIPPEKDDLIFVVTKHVGEKIKMFYCPYHV